jgi:hypothetical protein
MLASGPRGGSSRFRYRAFIARLIPVSIRRHIPLLIALLLPLMVMRGLLPAGYMAAAEDGKLRIVMCSAGLVTTGEAGSGSDSGQPSAAGTGDCLFAHAATVAPQVGCADAITPPPYRIYLASDHSITQPQATGPPRPAGARAPPTFLI